MSLWIRNTRSLIDFISYAMACAPDNYPPEDFVADSEPMTMVRAFDEIAGGLRFVEGIKNKDLLQQITSTFDMARETYKAGRYGEGSLVLQALQTLLSKARRLNGPQ